METVNSEEGKGCHMCLKGLYGCLSQCTANPIAIAQCSVCTLSQTFLGGGVRCIACADVLAKLINKCALRIESRKRKL